MRNCSLFVKTNSKGCATARLIRHLGMSPCWCSGGFIGGAKKPQVSFCSLRVILLRATGLGVEFLRIIHWSQLFDDDIEVRYIWGSGASPLNGTGGVLQGCAGLGWPGD